jgi:plastocyanin
MVGSWTTERVTSAPGPHDTARCDIRSATTIDPPGPRTRRIRPAHVIGAALALTALIMIVGAPAPWPQGHAAATTVGVGAGGDVFGPAAVTVAQGDTVTWNWVGGQHSVTSSSPSEPFDSGAQTAGTFAHTFNRAGTFRHLCVWHSGMTGTVVVTPAPSAATTAPAGAPGTTAATPGAASSAGSPNAAAPVAASAPPKLATVRVSGTRLAFSLDNPATVTTAAVAGRKTTPIGKAEAAKPGRGSMLLALNRLRVGRYTLLVSAKNSEGRSARVRVAVRVTWELRYRALRVQQALAAKAGTVAASVPVVGAADAPAAPATDPAPATASGMAAPTAPAPAPAPPVCDKTTTDHSGHGHGSADPRCDSSGHGG